jgi:hypothetical protein
MYGLSVAQIFLLCLTKLRILVISSLLACQILIILNMVHYMQVRLKLRPDKYCVVHSIHCRIALSHLKIHFISSYNYERLRYKS